MHRRGDPCAPKRDGGGRCRRRTNGCKRRAAYVVNGVRVVGFDNERGKGDHCHLRGRELPYRFTSVEALADDFIAAIEAVRSKA